MNRGFILPTTVFTLTVLALLSTIGSYYVNRSLSRAQIKFHGQLYNKIVSNELIASKMNPQISSINFQCHNENQQGSHITISKTICSKYGTASPLYDYSRVEADLTLCSAIKLSPYSQTNLGIPLSSGSIVSPRLCDEVPISIEKTIFIEGNLELTDPTLLTQSIFSSGYISTASTLTINNDLILIAGGDIILNDLIGDPVQPAKLTLISLTGKVSYITKSPDVTVFCKGQSINCPGGIATSIQLPNWIMQKGSMTISMQSLSP